ncbi:MAG: arginine--tRNA ligase [Candidatus Micrarchaeota archaeon]
MANALEKAVKEAGAKTGGAQQTATKSLDYGNVAFPLFAAAKEKKANPIKLAEETAAKIKPGKFVEKAEAVNGYVNVFFNNAFYAEAVNEANSENYGSNATGKNKVVVIDFSSPNIGKPLHIGHIRSTVLGDSVRKLHDYSGFKTIGANYLCEAGKQVALLMLGLHHFKAGKIKDEKQLLEYYVKINKEIEGKPELEKQAIDLVTKMETGEKTLDKELAEVRRVSLHGFKKAYETLGVSFDEEVYDSDMVKPSLKLVNEAVEKNIAFKDEDGETVANLEQHGLSNLVILRSNGTTLYSTRDLALAECYHKLAGKNHAGTIYVTASEQNTHFKQVFKILQLLGRDYAGKLTHIGFGLIHLKSGKLSSREGRVLLLEDVLATATNAAKKEIEARGQAEDVKHAANAIGVGATKFAILKVSPEKEITFDPEQIVKFEGDTGAFVQYSGVRANNILVKAGKTKPAVASNYSFNGHEKQLIHLLSLFPQTIENSCRNNQPHQLCDYLLKLSAAFNSFYVACPVLNAEREEEKASRLEIVSATRNVLFTGMRLLGIQPLEKM